MVISIISLIPKKKEAEISLSLKLKSDFLVLDFHAEISSEKIDNLVDTTGAGDIFAAGFLEYLIKDHEIQECGKRGIQLASKIIQQYGARF